MFRHAARVLSGGASAASTGDPATALLDALGYQPVDPAMADKSRGETVHRARLLMAAAAFPRLFQLDSVVAPGLVFFGAELATPTRLSASGVGLSFRAGFEGCVGEGIELSSQFLEINEKLTQFDPPAGARWDPGHFHAGLSPDTPTDWTPAQRLTGGGTVYVPTDMVVRRGEQRKLFVPYPLSIGCAAGRSLAAATLHGLLESIERDAAALWWRGGRRGRLLPLDSPAMGHASRVLAAIRQDQRGLRSWLLDITTDLGVPCVAAISVESDGFGFACGVAARMTLWAASQAAIQEMCQMELAREVVAAKRRERGEAGLNPLDLAHVRRAQEVDAARCVLLHPLPPAAAVSKVDRIDGWDAYPNAHFSDPAAVDPAAVDPVAGDPVAVDPAAANPGQAVRVLVQRLESRGIATAMVDLTRPEFGVPVVRVLCPGLEKEPSTQMGPRLRAAIAETGGGTVHTHDVPLM
jgi:ribosomal protein S12 methylthiotransferase accessory factor